MTLRTDPDLHALVRDQLDNQRKSRGLTASRPVAVVRARATGGLQIRADVEGHSFVSDERKSKGGGDTGPAPLRYFLAGVAMCYEVWVIKMAALDDIEVASLDSELAGFLGYPNGAEDEAAYRGFARLELEVRISSSAEPGQVLTVVAEAAKNCPALVTVCGFASMDLGVVLNGVRILEERGWSV